VKSNTQSIINPQPEPVFVSNASWMLKKAAKVLFFCRLIIRFRKGKRKYSTGNITLALIVGDRGDLYLLPIVREAIKSYLRRDREEK